jgi:hypothetical protein
MPRLLESIFTCSDANNNDLIEMLPNRILVSESHKNVGYSLIVDIFTVKDAKSYVTFHRGYKVIRYYDS